MKRTIHKMKEFKILILIPEEQQLTLKEFLQLSYKADQESLEWWEDENSLTM